MQTLRFTAHCAKGHPRIDFIERTAFDAHMIGEHHVSPRLPGGAEKRHRIMATGTYTDVVARAAAGWARGRMLEPYPWTPPKRDARGLERVTTRILDGDYVWRVGEPAAEIPEDRWEQLA